MWLTGLVEVVPSRDGDLEPKKAGRPSDDTATHDTAEHNHTITIPAFVEFVKAARTGLFRRSKGATLKFKRDRGDRKGSVPHNPVAPGNAAIIRR